MITGKYNVHAKDQIEILKKVLIGAELVEQNSKSSIIHVYCLSIVVILLYDGRIE